MIRFAFQIRDSLTNKDLKDTPSQHITRTRVKIRKWTRTGGCYRLKLNGDGETKTRLYFIISALIQDNIVREREKGDLEMARQRDCKIWYVIVVGWFVVCERRFIYSIDHNHRAIQLRRDNFSTLLVVWRHRS